MNELMNKPEKYHPVVVGLNQSVVKKIFSLMKLWKQNYRTRKQLKELPESLYDDLGIDRDMVKRESGRQFWD